MKATSRPGKENKNEKREATSQRQHPKKKKKKKKKKEEEEGIERIGHMQVHVSIFVH